MTDLVMRDLAMCLPPGRSAAPHPLIVEALAQEAVAIATPEQLGFEDERRHTENARALGLVAQPVVLGAALAHQEIRESGRRTRFDQQRLDRRDVLGIELPPPE